MNKYLLSIGAFCGVRDDKGEDVNGINETVNT